ncbi:hypothetical protein TUSST3_55520 [Streptomyces sp. TUS-ST3]|nr:hypothetical protein TUSST3_55520 [Streptomyces sp. TUS-ST3]
MKGGSFSGHVAEWSQGAGGARFVWHPMRWQVSRPGLLRRLGGQEDGSQECPGDRDESRDDARDAQAVVEGPDRGVADGLREDRPALGGDVAGDLVRCPDGLMGERSQLGRQPGRQGGR